MTVHIIGNGPSQELFNPFEVATDDLIVGCNIPSHDVQYSVIADCACAKFFREGAKFHERLEDFEIVLGRRGWNGLSTIKARSGSTEKMTDVLPIHGIVEYPEMVLPQQYLSSGHLAYIFARETWPDHDIVLYGFDSVFTGNHMATTSNRIVRDNDVEVSRKGDTTLTSTAWKEMWEMLFDKYNDKSITTTFVGYDNDVLPFTIDNVHEILR